MGGTFSDLPGRGEDRRGVNDKDAGQKVWIEIADRVEDVLHVVEVLHQ